MADTVSGVFSANYTPCLHASSTGLCMMISNVRIERTTITTLNRLSEYRLPIVNVSFHMAAVVQPSFVTVSGLCYFIDVTGE